MNHLPLKCLKEFGRKWSGFAEIPLLKWENVSYLLYHLHLCGAFSICTDTWRFRAKSFFTYPQEGRGLHVWSVPCGSLSTSTSRLELALQCPCQSPMSSGTFMLTFNLKQLKQWLAHRKHLIDTLSNGWMNAFPSPLSTLWINYPSLTEINWGHFSNLLVSGLGLQGNTPRYLQGKRELF